MFAFQRATVFSVLLAVSCLVLRIKCSKKLPGYVKPCSRSSPSKAFQKCVEKNINAMKPYMAEGIPELRIPSQDPIHIERVTMDTGAFRGEFFNVTLTGCSNFSATDVNLDWDTNVLTMRLNYPHVFIQAEYKVVGKVLLLQLDSVGDGWIDTNDVDLDLKMKGKLRRERGKTFLDFNDDNRNELKQKAKGKIEMQLNNLFKDEVLTKTTNFVINENIKGIMKEHMPLMEGLIAQRTFRSIKGVFNAFSLDDLVLP